MTDPNIYLPIELVQLGADGSASMAVVNADLARRIVALAGIRVCDIEDDLAATPDKLDQEWRDPNGPGPQPTPADAGDEAAVAAMHAVANWNDEPVCRAILAAIKAGKVPGVCCDNDPNALARRLAQDCADHLNKIQRIEAECDRLRAELEAEKCADERDTVLRDLAQSKVEVSALYEDFKVIAAQRDRLAGLLRKHAALECPCCNGIGLDMSAEEDRLCGTCAGSGSAYPADVVAALSELEKKP